jgi:3-oxoacyl-[acyl-carrier protein] reductase
MSGRSLPSSLAAADGHEVPAGAHRRVALVTGGTRGIGAAVSRRLAAEGALVAANYRGDAHSAEAILEQLGPEATTWAADVGDTSAAARMVGDVIAHYGRLDVVVANAGVWRGGLVENISPEDWATVLNASLSGAYNVVRAALPTMRAAGYGRIVAVSSVVGLIGWPGDAAYAAAKAGLIGLVKSLAKETGRSGITVNAVAPGFIETDMTAAVPAASREQLLRRVSILRPGAAEEVAAAVRYLVCEGDYVTGHTLVVDGGLRL